MDLFTEGEEKRKGEERKEKMKKKRRKKKKRVRALFVDPDMGRNKASRKAKLNWAQLRHGNN